MDRTEKILTELGQHARTAPPSSIDVTPSVMRRLPDVSVSPTWEKAPLVIAMISVAIAASVTLMFLPSWQIMNEPWICYF
ncbi:MAG: hypothetical protein R3C28_08030 [Pirellulaceae bacterium]